MQKFLHSPNLDMYVGVKVTKETELEFENENVKQSLKDLILHSVTTIEKDNYKSTYDTTIKLEEGDVLIFEEDGRGYIKPVERFVTIEEAIEDYTNIKDLG